MILLLAVSASILVIYAATQKWGAFVLWFLAAAVSFAGTSGVLAERLWGTRSSWNFAHHDPAYAIGEFVMGACFLVFGLVSCRRHFMPTSRVVGRDETSQPPPRA